MTNFITGATGFIGQRLLKTGLKKVRILSRHPHSEYKTVICDLQSQQIPEDALLGVNTVFHLAGLTHDLFGAKKIEHLYRLLNVDTTFRLMELAVSSGVQRFIFVSSTKAGGLPLSGQCMTESDQGDPEGIYGQTKREAELKILEIGRQSGIHVSIVRPSLVYGKGVKGNLALMQSGIKHGWFPPLPETGNHISMIHVDDLVRALVLVATDDRTNGEIFIATDGIPHSSAEIYAAICKGIGKNVPRWSLPKFMFDGVTIFSSRLKYKVEKLFGNEYYSSEKLESLGYKAKKSLVNFYD